MLTGGEGSGKSHLGACIGVCRSIDMGFNDGSFSNSRAKTKERLYWIVGSDYENARKEFDYTVEFLEELGEIETKSISSHKDQKCLVTTRYGAIFETVSAHDPLKIGREQPDGIIGAEASLWEREVWDRCYGRLARKRPDSWGYYTGSFEQSRDPWFREVAELGRGANKLDVRSLSLPAWANRTIYPLGYADPAIQQLIEQTGGENSPRFLERYAGQPAPSVDAVLPEFKTIMHVSDGAEYNPDEPVFLFIDPAGGGIYAVLFVQLLGDYVNVVDEVFQAGWTHELIIEACMSKPAWGGVGAHGNWMDVGGAQHHLGQDSATEAWGKHPGIAFNFEKRSIIDEVDKLRSVLSTNPITLRPRLQINPRCEGLISEMGGTPNPVLPDRGRWTVRGGVPDKKNCDSAKALAYGLLGHYGATHVRKREDYGEEQLSSTSYLGYVEDSDRLLPKRIKVEGDDGTVKFLERV